MQKSGGIIALIAGIFGFIAAILTLMVGGLYEAVINEVSSQIGVFVGLLGILFSFLTIILGAIAMGTKTRIVGYLLIVCALVGAITGGTLVAVCMALALAGGIVATIGVKGNKNEPDNLSET